jgi:hypothetical protein
VEEGSNAEAAGIKVGDTLRACNSIAEKIEIKSKSFGYKTAEFVLEKIYNLDIDYKPLSLDQTNNKDLIISPSMQIRSLFMADGRNFEAVQRAVESNKQDGSARLVFERRNPKAVVMNATSILFPAYEEPKRPIVKIDILSDNV